MFSLHRCFSIWILDFELDFNYSNTIAFFFDVGDCWFYTASIYSFLDFYFMWNPSIVVSKNLLHKVLTQYLTLSWRRPLSYKNQFIDLLFKSVDWFLYNNALHHERVKLFLKYNSWRCSFDFFSCVFLLRNDGQISF